MEKRNSFPITIQSPASEIYIKIKVKKYCISLNKIRLIKTFLFIYIILFFLTAFLNNANLQIIIHNNNNNEGFLKIKTIHKSKFRHYNYTDNIVVYKDLYNNISYTPITELNCIVKSYKIPFKKYFELCEKNVILDKTKYKRNAKPKISVIIPFYNIDKFSIFIPLRSIQNQSFKDIEIIFVDDGSSENKLKEVFKEMENDNRIIILKHKINKGTLMTRVDGVRYASGEYILNLDQDDLFLDNIVFQKIYNKAKKLNVDILQFSTLWYKNKKQKSILKITTPKRVIVTQPELRVAFLNKIGNNRLSYCSTRMIWDKFVKRKTYLKAI